MHIKIDNMCMKLSAQQRLKLNLICERAAGILYPRTCPSCGKIIPPPGKDLMPFKELTRSSNVKDPFLCGPCLEKLEYCADRPCCMKCGSPLDDEREEYCRDCMEKERSFDRGMAALIHNEAARKLIYGLKYSGLRINADAAAFEMVKALKSRYDDINDSVLLQVDAVIPVPLHRKRHRERGYNQAELIAGRLQFFLELAGCRKIPVDNEYLIRTAGTARLKEMSGAERVSSLHGAFAVSGSPGKYRSVLLIDDIFTTGATLNECAKTLRQAGVSMIYFMTVTTGS